MSRQPVDHSQRGVLTQGDASSPSARIDWLKGRDLGRAGAARGGRGTEDAHRGREERCPAAVEHPKLWHTVERKGYTKRLPNGHRGGPGQEESTRIHS
ncbi:hypothetical protein PC128_g27259 [Phytophthora cactorum]|nr:hypothetical protein PC128_g27259 [Phytophthora cactorum]